MSAAVDPLVVRLRGMARAAEQLRPGPWQVQDGCSFRRIGQQHGRGPRDGSVVQAITQRDGHPDLLAQRPVLDLIAAMDGATVLLLLDTIERQAAQLAARDDVRAGLEMAARWLEDQASQLADDHAYWGGEEQREEAQRLRERAKSIRALPPEPEPSSLRNAQITPEPEPPAGQREGVGERNACIALVEEWAARDERDAAAALHPHIANTLGCRARALRLVADVFRCGDHRPDHTPPPGGDAAEVAWAVERWNTQVAIRPLRNQHRAALDGAWRQVVRHFGGDPDALLGPDHWTRVECAALSRPGLAEGA